MTRLTHAVPCVSSQVVLRQQNLYLRLGDPIYWLQLDINKGNAQVPYRRKQSMKMGSEIVHAMHARSRVRSTAYPPAHQPAGVSAWLPLCAPLPVLCERLIRGVLAAHRFGYGAKLAAPRPKRS